MKKKCPHLLNDLFWDWCKKYEKWVSDRVCYFCPDNPASLSRHRSDNEDEDGMRPFGYPASLSKERKEK